MKKAKEILREAAEMALISALMLGVWVFFTCCLPALMGM